MKKKHGDYAGVVDIARNGIDRVIMLEDECARLRAEVQMLRATVVDSARDVIDWCDKNPPAGDALYCIARCGATAKEPYGPVVPMERKREVVRQAIERMKELPSSGGPFVFDEKLSAILSELRPNTCYATDRRITPQPNAASSAEETE